MFAPRLPCIIISPSLASCLHQGYPASSSAPAWPHVCTKATLHPQQPQPGLMFAPRLPCIISSPSLASCLHQGYPASSIFSAHAMVATESLPMATEGGSFSGGMSGPLSPAPLCPLDRREWAGKPARAHPPQSAWLQQSRMWMGGPQGQVIGENGERAPAPAPQQSTWLAAAERMRAGGWAR